MKKLMIAAVAVAMAAVAQAAAVSWTSGVATAGFKNPDGAKITSAMGYTLTVAFYSDSAGTTEIATSSSSSPNGMTGAFSATTPTTGTGSYDFANKSTYYVKAVITDGKNENSTDILAFTMPDTGNASLNFTTGGGFASSGNKWNGWTSVGPTPIPEPTSGLLMLLGVAGLALKRKRA